MARRSSGKKIASQSTPNVESNLEPSRKDGETDSEYQTRLRDWYQAGTLAGVLVQAIEAASHVRTLETVDQGQKVNSKKSKGKHKRVDTPPRTGRPVSTAEDRGEGTSTGPGTIGAADGNRQRNTATSTRKQNTRYQKEEDHRAEEDVDQELEVARAIQDAQKEALTTGWHGELAVSIINTYREIIFILGDFYAGLWGVCEAKHCLPSSDPGRGRNVRYVP